MHARSRLLHSIVYLVEPRRWRSWQHCYWSLYLLDFSVYGQLGRSVTGLDYVATPTGPSPEALCRELEAPAPDLAASIAITNLVLDGDHLVRTAYPLIHFQPEKFTTCELTMLYDLGCRCHVNGSFVLDERTYLPHEPWRRALEREQSRRPAPIRYVAANQLPMALPEPGWS